MALSTLSNPSQLLMRNDDLLQAATPLLVNCPDPEFCRQLQTLNPDAAISAFNVNFAEHQKIASVANIDARFSEQYQTDKSHDLIIIYFPKSKHEFLYLLSMLASVLHKDGLVLVVGDNKGGVKSSQKLASDLTQHYQKLDSARHCSLFSCTFATNIPEFILDSWIESFDVKIAGQSLHVKHLPGVFSRGELDKGTALLLANLPTSMEGNVLDFGCGAGVIGAFIARVYPKTQAHLLDVNAMAIASARLTLEANGVTGKVFASDGLSQVSEKYQYVVSNPPFHQGIKTHYATTEIFLKDIRKFMSAKGQLSIVANSFLKYPPILKQHFKHYELKATGQGFSIHHCD
ncbi:methyltransferase [Thalassotalea litorea]|uniref:Ribosomal RNA small subunit methyltransferase C n=1 Tax=Thalassotalea litorea TaxID=2020715 RepID=A0A5R9ISX2_9GAMM|nr:methyltransferase [Thalassotalea litorea]TLU67157.1 methyltransferase [Thalassotalea litorea]